MIVRILSWALLLGGLIVTCFVLGIFATSSVVGFDYHCCIAADACRRNELYIIGWGDCAGRMNCSLYREYILGCDSEMDLATRTILIYMGSGCVAFIIMLALCQLSKCYCHRGYSTV